MWQRIQTVYMVLASVISFAGYLALPLYYINDTPLMVTDVKWLFFASGLSGGILIANVFNFKKRPVQIVLNRAAILLNFVLFFSILAMFFGLLGEQGTAPGAAMYTSLLVVLLVVLANRGITKDEKIVRSADRLR